jgi:amino-acid N-acetyltransferase
MLSEIQPFSERAFYLGEFRGRSIGIAWPQEERPELEPLAAVIEELVANQTRVIVMSPLPEVLAVGAGEEPVDLATADFAARLWRRLREAGCAGLRIGADGFESCCEQATLRLRLAKLVWIRSAPPVARGVDAERNARVSVVDLAHLARLCEEGSEEGAGPIDSELVACPGSAPLLDAIRSMIAGGVPAVNVCAARDLEQELFTYAGAGIFFTRDRYAEVRPLALDDFDAASDLIARGEADGYLVPRSLSARDAVLAHGVGVFIEGRYLAGIGAILPHPAENAAEIASLYAMTRYVGEGIGSQIVRHAIERVRTEGLAYAFSCTTSDRVERFFERHGFRRVGQEQIPAAKWEGYNLARREHVRCLRFDP